jgi:hypothetical protein
MYLPNPSADLLHRALDHWAGFLVCLGFLVVTLKSLL